ncbi:hypothetical protein P3R38_13205 [Pseudomonas sp. NyZ480]|uniref:hypothetical protein n=1 Tax=Pseudomonas sp. NyZ480 TaxID=3035289 RepID=UPI00240A7047|nr:hypothetical protein [Pseudomonas sp. NyZ480]WEZ86480.1 hypothetical protein P3R38_13205 [Pseudomonas sp. NyZ480]
MDFQKISWLAIGIIVTLFYKHFFPGYLKKKGENLATKEDISDITNKIESVKHEYASQLENAKADLSALVTRHGFRYEKEFEILGRLTELLVELRDACNNLRPAVDFKDPALTEREIKQTRLSRLYDAGRQLYRECETKRPFFPSDIFNSISAIIKAAHLESTEYLIKDPFKGDDFLSYWESAEKNQKEVTQAVENAMELIRQRVTKWDSI